MKLLWIPLLLGGMALAQSPQCVYYADDLERSPQTLELGANFLTELVGWLPIEDAKSARTDLLRLQRDPRNPNLLNIASKPGSSERTDLFLKIDGRTLRFRLLLGTRTAPGRCLILKERPKAGQSMVIVRDPPPTDAQAQTQNTNPSTTTGPIPATPMETAAAPQTPPPSRRGAYFGLSLGYPPLPVQGSLSSANLWYGVMMAIEELVLGLDVQLGGGWLPSSGAGLLEGYLVLPFSRSQPLNFYVGLGGGVVFDRPNYPFVGGLVGVDFGLLEGVRGWLEATPRYLMSSEGNQVIVGARVGIKLFP